MTRVKGGYSTRRKRKKVKKQAKGYFGNKSIHFKKAKEQMLKSMNYAFRDRKQCKRNFRKLWIQRINAASREYGLSYSKFMNGLNKANIMINRKMLSQLAIHNTSEFLILITKSKNILI